MNPTDRKYYGGINNTIQYKACELTLQVQYANQEGSRDLRYLPGSRYNQTTEVLGRWFAPGDQTDIQRFATDYTPPGSNQVADPYLNFIRLSESNYNIQNASFVRLKSLSFSYSFEPSLLQKIKVQQAKLFVQGQNLLTITRYKGLDPETGNGLPPLRMFTGGVQLRF
jgi:hypothetical protein